MKQTIRLERRAFLQFLTYVKSKRNLRKEEDSKIHNFLSSNNLRNKEDRLFGIFLYTLVGSDSALHASRVQNCVGKFTQMNPNWRRRLRGIEKHFRFLSHRYRVSVRDETDPKTVINAVDSYLRLMNRQRIESQEAFFLSKIASTPKPHRFENLYRYFVTADPIHSFGQTSYYDWLVNVDSQHVLSLPFPPQRIYFTKRSPHLRDGLRKAAGIRTNDSERMEAISSELFASISHRVTGYTMRELENHLCMFGKS